MANMLLSTYSAPNRDLLVIKSDFKKKTVLHYIPDLKALICIKLRHKSWRSRKSKGFTMIKKSIQTTTCLLVVSLTSDLRMYLLLNIFLDQSSLLLLANLIYADSQFFHCGSYREEFYLTKCP